MEVVLCDERTKRRGHIHSVLGLETVVAADRISSFWEVWKVCSKARGSEPRVMQKHAKRAYRVMLRAKVIYIMAGRAARRLRKSLDQTARHQHVPMPWLGASRHDDAFRVVRE